MRARTRSLLCALALLTAAAAASAQPTAADRESARAAFTEANQLRDAGKVREALEKYKAAFALAPTPVTALEVGRAQADLGQLVEARETLLGVEHLAEGGQESAKSRAARKEASELAGKLAPRIPKIIIRVVGQAEDLAVSVDGNAVPRAALTVARSLNPGRHAVMAVAFGHSVTQTVDLREGDTRDVVLDITSITPAHGAIAQPSGPPVVGGLGLSAGAGGPVASSGVVAFNQPDDGHAWSLQDPQGKDLCRLPCAQSLGFGVGYAVVRDDGEKVSVPGGLAALPGTTAQVEPHGHGGSVAVGWTLVGVGGAAMIGGLIAMLAGGVSTTPSGTIDDGPLVAGGVVAGVGALVVTAGTYVLAFSHGPMLLRTDSGMPVRVSLSPTGIVGTF